MCPENDILRFQNAHEGRGFYPEIQIRPFLEDYRPTERENTGDWDCSHNWVVKFSSSSQS